MKQKLGWRVALIVAVLAIASWYLYPLSESIVLGLDLKGGMYLTLEVDLDKLAETNPDADPEDAVNRALEIIRSRVDEFGVAEPSIVREGENRIVVQLPGIRNLERAKELIRNTAMLEFKLVHNEFLEEAQAGNVPEGYELNYIYKKDDQGHYRATDPVVLRSQAALTGDYLTKAQVRWDNSNMARRPIIAIEFNEEGAELFSQLTASNIKERLAIVLDDKVVSAPVINDRIPNGKAVIEGDFTVDQANDLRIILESGSLPAPVSIIEDRTIGPSLGKDSIRKGIIAGCVGGLLVVLFMLSYYKFAGMIANLALLLNLVILFGALAMLHATLTLPGIAGIILTLGMAVDANVIIFERIREELKLGKTIRAAIDAGFQKALSAIIDANLTTILTAIVLYQYGTGAIRGFAVTLMLGIIGSMFTALFVSRTLFDIATASPQVKKLSI